MRPWVVATSLSALMCLTSTCYFFQIPDDLRKKDEHRAGHWGSPDAEFNWCEPDYELLHWIAEPVNTVSCLPMIILPAVFLSMHEAPADIRIMALLEVLIAIGSMLFHASLRYTMQLADEIPMLWYIAAVASSFVRRIQGTDLSFSAFAWVASTTAGVLLTEQHSLAHEAFRGIMTTTFCACLVATGWGVAAAVQRLKDELPEKRRVAMSAERILEVGLAMFLASVVAWLLDNYFCATLRQLPGGLPYPQLHTWWHILVAGALHCVMIIIQAHSRRSSEKLSIRYVLGVIPVVQG